MFDGYIHKHRILKGLFCCMVCDKLCRDPHQRYFYSPKHQINQELWMCKKCSNKLFTKESHAVGLIVEYPRYKRSDLRN